ncbi:MAG: type IV pilus modification protein PilV [Gammaproteobacteria bacterium]|nr:type IV pilus modification protein PilV [Gammaproteobacteria bacterium]
MSINTFKNAGSLKWRKSKGFTLLEAMIGFFILSIGMLGIASLQSLSLKAGKTAVYGAVASMKIEELFESMRANPESLSTYAGAGANNSCTAVKDCTAVQLAEDDVFWWKKNLSAGLPAAATTTVTVTDAVAPSKLATVSILVGWNERSDSTAGASVAKSYTVTTHVCIANPC